MAGGRGFELDFGLGRLRMTLVHRERQGVVCLDNLLIGSQIENRLNPFYEGRARRPDDRNCSCDCPLRQCIRLFLSLLYPPLAIAQGINTFFVWSD
jgi:hypothetical protein